MREDRTGGDGRVEGRGRESHSSIGKKLDHLCFDLGRCQSERGGRVVRDVGRRKNRAVVRKKEKDGAE